MARIDDAVLSTGYYMVLPVDSDVTSLHEMCRSLLLAIPIYKVGTDGFLF